MKNLKKVLALVIAFSMMLSVAAFASYPDVADDAAYKTAVDTLSALEILKGDDQGNFNPDATITRAEFAAVVCRALGLESSANSAKGATIFTDVPADFWGTGYINLATQLGIIVGAGDGTFDPDGPVTYEQAVKMLVVALGFEPMAAQKGGWPTGYLVVASTYNMGDGIVAPANSDPAKRSVVAQLTFNALDVPLMEQTGYGNNIEYTIYDGDNKDRKTLLTDKLGVAKLAGQVVANERVNYTATNGTKEGTIRFVYDENFKNKDEDWAVATTIYGEKLPTTVTPDPYYGETGADKYVGYRCVAYVKELNNGDNEIVYIEPQEGKNVVVEIAATDIDPEATRNDYDNICYLETEDARSATVLDLSYTEDGDEAYYVVWNNTSYSGDAAADKIDELKDSNKADVYEGDTLKVDYTPIAARVILIDWENDGYVDLVKVDEYQHAVVTEVNVARGKIVTADYTIDLKLDEKDIFTSIEDIDGNTVALEDIAADDVLAMISDVPNKDARYYDESLEIVVLPSAEYKVSGTVTEENTQGTTPSIAIDGTTYELSANDAKISNYNQILLGSTGDFFLGIDGKVVGFIGARGGSNGTMAIILQTGEGGGSFNQDAVDIKMLNEKGEVVVYTTDKKIKLWNEVKTGVFASSSFTVADEIADVSMFDNTSFAANMTDNITVKDFLLSFSEELAITAKGAYKTEDAFAAELKERVVKYKVNSSNQVTDLIPWTSASSDDDGLFNIYEANGAYKAGLNRLDSKDLADNAVVFNLKTADLTKTNVSDASILTDEGDYVALLADEIDGYYAAAIIISGDADFNNENGWAVVTAKSNTKIDDVDAVKVTVVENGATETTALLFTDEDSEATDSSDYNDLAVGSVLLYNASGDGLVSEYSIIGNVSGDSFALNYANGVEFESGKEDVAYYYGFLAETRSGRITVAYENEATDDTDDYALATFKVSGANEYFLNNARTNAKVEVGGFEDGDVAGPEIVDIDDPKEAYVSNVVLRVVDGDVVDIMSLNNRVKVTIAEIVDDSDVALDIDWE